MVTITVLVGQMFEAGILPDFLKPPGGPHLQLQPTERQVAPPFCP
jgi:hypothetical protein